MRFRKKREREVNLIVAIFIQAIEAMDRNRVCTEYWDSRPYSRPQVQIPQTSQYKDSEERNDPGGPGNPLLPVGVDRILRGLFKKANPEELNSLYSILSDNRPTADLGLVNQLLNEEIHNHPRWFIIWSHENLRPNSIWKVFFFFFWLCKFSVPAARLHLRCSQPGHSLTKEVTLRKERKIRKRKWLHFLWNFRHIGC